MGIHTPNLDFLLKFRGRSLGEMLILGRQGFHITPHLVDAHYIAAAEALLKNYDPSAQLESFNDGGFADPLFIYLGATSVTTLDASPYEGAQIIHDLNQPVPRELHSRFGAVFDGGTLEHVYDIPTAFRNVTAMLKPGGLFLMATVANNFLGHGLYQFSPELLWRAFAPEAGFEIELMQLVDEAPTPQPIDCIDSIRAGKRQEIRVTHGCTLLMMAARKVSEGAAHAVYQSDYKTIWDASAKAQS